MRTIRFIISMSVIAVILSLGLSTSTHAQAEDDQLKAVYPNLINDNVNWKCPQGSDKMFIVNFTVPKRTKIKEFLEFRMLLKSGNEISDEGYRVSKRRVDYYLFPPSRKAKVDLSDTRYTLAYAAYTSHTYTVSISSDCIEELPEGQE